MKGTHLLLIVNINTLEKGAPPDTFGVPYCLLHREFYGLRTESMFQG